MADRRGTVALTQQELEGRLWAAANSLRGPVDPSDFKAYIFPLLFYKRVTDAWDDEHDRAVADYGSDVTPDIEADYHRFQLPDGCHWRDLRKIHENVGVGLQNILDRIQQANPDTLAGIFGDVAWGNKDKLPEHALLNLIEAFHTLDLSPSRVGHDVLGNAYEYLLKQFADESGKKAGEFFTPRSVVRLLTRILDPQATDTVYDPACGSGGMLVEAANEVLESGGSLRQMRFYGQEVNLTTAAIARMNLFLHDIEDVIIRRGDTLRDPKFLDERGHLQRFNVVITNPPFSLKNWGAEVWRHDPWGRAACGVPPATVGDFAWVQHMLASMTSGSGRVGVVMPHGVLFRGGAERTIRQCLLRDDRLDAVIGLAPNLFYSTPIPATLLIFRAAKTPERRGHVLFIDGSKQFAKGRNQSSLRAQDVETLVEAYQTGADANCDVAAEVRLVPLGEIEANGWDLNIGRYIKSATAEVLDVESALARLADAQLAVREAEARLAEQLVAMGYVEPGVDSDAAVPVESRERDGAQAIETTLGATAAFQNGYPFKPEDLGDEGLPVIRIKQMLDPAERPDRSRVEVSPRHHINDGDLIFSWSGTLAVRLWDRGPALLNQHLFRVVEREGVDRRWLRFALENAVEALAAKTHGTTMKHITKAELLPHPVRLPPLSEQRRTAALLDAMDEVVTANANAQMAAQALANALRADRLTDNGETSDPDDVT